MRKQVVVIGLGRFGTTVTRTLRQLDHQVLAIDRSDHAVQEVAPYATETVQADATDEATLRDLGIGNFDIAIVAIGSDIPTSLMTTVLLKRLGVPYVVARAQNDLHGAILEKVGADRVISPELDTGTRLAHSLTFPKVVDYLDVARDFGISKLTPPESFVGKTLEELGLAARRQQDGVNVLLIRRGNNQVVITPDRFEKVLKGDVLVVAGKDEALDRLRLS